MFFRFGGGNEPVRSLLRGLDIAPLAVIFVMMDPIIIVGTFMEWFANAYITVPIFAPVVAGFGFEPVRRAVCREHPDPLPVPILCPARFRPKSVAPPEIALQQIFGAVLPFIGPVVAMTFPGIAPYLPRLLEREVG